MELPGPVLRGRRLGAARLPAACAAAAAGLPAVGGHDAARRHRVDHWLGVGENDGFQTGFVLGGFWNL